MMIQRWDLGGQISRSSDLGGIFEARGSTILPLLQQVCCKPVTSEGYLGARIHHSSIVPFDSSLHSTRIYSTRSAVCKATSTAITLCGSAALAPPCHITFRWSLCYILVSG